MSLIFCDNSWHAIFVRNQRSFVKHRQKNTNTKQTNTNAHICHLEVMVVYLTGYLPNNL